MTCPAHIDVRGDRRSCPLHAGHIHAHYAAALSTAERMDGQPALDIYTWTGR